MIFSPGAGNTLLALSAAVLWGGGDFSGGMGAKSAGGTLRAALRVVLLSHITSLIVLLAAVRFRGDPFPHGAPLMWGIAGGVAGGLALTCFYIALSRGAMGVSAAVSGLLAAAIPGIVASVAEGSPGLRRLLGFGVAGIAIWMIAASPVTEKAPAATSALAVAAGAGFGIYFVALKMASPAGVIWPMATARIGSVTVCSLWALAIPLFNRSHREPPIPFTRVIVGWALATALLDTGGNLLFVAAARAGRLDVAAVLASLYPASTILLAAWLLREHPTRRQALGMAVAAVAVVLISI